MFLLLCANQSYSLVYDTRQDFFFKNTKYCMYDHFGSVSVIFWLRFGNSSDGVVIFETWKWKNTIFQYICFVVGEIVDYSTWETEYNFLYKNDPDKKINNNSISQLTLWVRIPPMARCTRCNIMWSKFTVTCDRSVVFSCYSGFVHQ